MPKAKKPTPAQKVKPETKQTRSKPIPAPVLSVDPLENEVASAAMGSENRQLSERKVADSKTDRTNGEQSSTKESNPGVEQKRAKPSGTRKKRVIIIILCVVVLTAVLTAGIIIARRKSAPAIKRNTQVKVAVVPPRPKTMASPLTGVEVSPEQAEHPVTSVIIENLYPNARPQSGLSSAGIVLETLAEGGITRYQALFGDTFPTDIGPVRSIRTYFVRWGLEYNVPVVHAGGNADALDMIGPLGMKNLDEFAFGNYFRRITTRYAPHNLYTTGKQLEDLMAARGFNTKPTFTPWLRKDDAPSKAPTASSITISPSYYDYQISYAYDPTDNSYARSIRGAVDIDANGNTPIKPKNVVVLKAPTSYGLTRSGEQTVIIQTVGSGSGVVFMDGVATEVTWRKLSDSGRTQFFDATGKEVALNRGQTWVTVIPTERTFSYQ